MAELNGVELREPDPLKWDEYAGTTASPQGDAKPRFVLAPKGVYTVLAKDRPTKGATREGYLQYELGNLILSAPGQPYDNQEIRYTRVNTKRWPNREASSLADYLVAHGDQTKPNTNAEYEAAVERVWATPAQVRVNWRGRCKSCGFEIKGYDDFPTRDDGSKASIVDCPTCKANDNQERPIFANLEIKAFLTP